MDSRKELKIEKAKELKNSTPLRKYKVSKYPQIEPVIDYLYDEMIQEYDFRLTRKSNIQKLKHHIEFFITNLYAVYKTDPTKVIAYPRNRNEYSQKKSNYKKWGLSFRYSVEDPSNGEGKGVVNFLDRSDYIQTFNFRRDHNDPSKSRQSRMRATPKLIDLIESKSKVTSEMVKQDYSGEETIIVKGKKSKPKYKNIKRNGKKKRIKEPGKRKIVKTPEKPAVREMRRNLEFINDLMEKTDIILEISDTELQDLNELLLDDPDPYKEPVDYSRKRLHRVFLDRRIDLGGRFYGPWYQNVYKEYRKRILIDGAPTLELDYSALHPRLLYGVLKLPIPEDDLYSVSGYSEETRDFMKAFFLRILNASSKEEAIGSILHSAFKEKSIPIPEESNNLEESYLDSLINEFEKKHAPIRHLFFKGYGNYLQWLDSQVAEKILLHFAHKGVAVLPLHDGFIIDFRRWTELYKIMQKAFVNNFGTTIPISNDNFDNLLDHFIEVAKRKIREGSIDAEEFATFIKELNEGVLPEISEGLKYLERKYLGRSEDL